MTAQLATGGSGAFGGGGVIHRARRCEDLRREVSEYERIGFSFGDDV